MTWWYENEEEKMEFDKSRVYSAVNADELKPGDKVIVAYSLSYLTHCVECDECLDEIVSILSDDNQNRFLISGNRTFALAYLVERKENCTNCEGCVACIKPDKTFRCEDYSPKTEPKECPECKHIDWTSDEVCLKKHKIGKGVADYCSDFERAEDKGCKNCGVSGCIRAGVDNNIKCENYKPKNKKEIDMDNWNYLDYFGCSLPEKQEMGTSDRVVVAVKGYNVPDVGYYDYELEAWFVDGNRYPVPVYAWHYDKPPREA